jgi:hypothetical protein
VGGWLRIGFNPPINLGHLRAGDRVSLSVDLIGYPEWPYRGKDFGVRGVARNIFWMSRPAP